MPFTESKSIKSRAVVLGIGLFLWLWPNTAPAEDYLSTADIAAISAGSLGTVALGEYARHFDSSRSARIEGPLPLETSLQKWLGGTYTSRKTNFLDQRFGGLITPAVCGLALISVDLSWPQGQKNKTTLQDLLLFSAGALANTGINNIAKGLVARPRPYVVLYPDELPDHYRDNYAFNHSSFYSGHTSSAFFSATYLNKRIRAIMRMEMSADDYHGWRWAPPVLLYGWSTFVAWSRISTYRHYISDVAVGALAGYLIAELFFSFNESAEDSPNNQIVSPTMFRITIPL